MKLICIQENLKKAISNTERIVSKQNTLPILNNLLLEAKKGRLSISATNLEIGIISNISAKVEKIGKITVSSKILSSFVNNLEEDEKVRLELKGDILKISSGKSKANIKSIPTDDFPLIPQKKSEFLFSLGSGKLREAISRTLVCVAFNETRQELTGVDVVFGKNKLFFAATDSFRLAEQTVELEKNDIGANYLAFIEKNENIIVPATTFAELIRIIQNEELGLIKVAVEEGQIFFELGSTQLVSRLINGNYPDYKHIMPSEYKTRVVGEKEKIVRALKMASIFSSQSNEIVLKVDTKKPSKVVIEASSDEAGENSSEIELEVSGPNQEVVFSPRYLVDGFNTVGTEKVAILLNDDKSPTALREINEKDGKILGDYVYIVMPIKK